MQRTRLLLALALILQVSSCDFISWDDMPKGWCRYAPQCECHGCDDQIGH